MKKLLILLAILPLTVACATKLKYEAKATKTVKSLEASITYPSGTYDCTLDPILGVSMRCNHFILNVKNNSSQDYFIDWNNSYYLQDGQSNGGFYFDGIVIKDRNNPKSDDVVLSGSTITKEIYPNNLTEFYSNQLTLASSWKTKGFPLGENGVYLTVKDSKGVKSVFKLNLSLSK